MQNPEVRREEESEEEEEEESLESLKQRANEDYILFLQTVLLPREEDDPTYIRSFALEETEAIQQFYQRYGLVVIRDVFSSQECQDTVEDIFSLLEQGSKQRWQRSDPSTWGNWPSSGIEKYGMPSKAPVTTRVAFRNRQNAKLLQACSTLFTKDTELMISIDRYGLCRPTVGVPFGSSLKDMPQWKTAPSLHLDVNPWAFLSETNHALPKLSALEYGRHRLNDFIFENNQVHHSTSANGVHIQGVINLLDNREEDGGFHCVPGFLHCFEAWAKENEHSQTEQKAWG
ncbi:NADAR domain-containing protein [Balamuthia mandrillaris]